jgi:uncharacterized protein YbjQ (UPF0145 family)
MEAFAELWQFLIIILLLILAFFTGSIAPATTLVRGSVVISVDYFKRFLARLRMIFGGRIHTYESLLDRARREAILRMQEQARELGASMIFNMRFETSSISKGRKDAVGTVEVLAYGTAVIPKE